MSAPVTSSAASKVQPPVKTARRAKSRLFFAEKFVRPLDRRAERLLPRIEIAATVEQVEPPREPSADLGRREHSGACRGEFDRERQVVQAATEAGNLLAGRRRERAQRAPPPRFRRGAAQETRPRPEAAIARGSSPVAAGSGRRSRAPRAPLPHRSPARSCPAGEAACGCLSVGRSFRCAQRLRDRLHDEGGVAHARESDPKTPSG